MAYRHTEKTERGHKADRMDEATRMPGAPAVVKKRYRQTVPRMSQVGFKPLGRIGESKSQSSNLEGRFGPTIPATNTANSVTTGICADGLSRALTARAFPSHSKVEAEKKAKDIDSAVIRGGSGVSVSIAVSVSEAEMLGDNSVLFPCFVFVFGVGSGYLLANRLEIGKYTSAPMLSMHNPVAIASGLAFSAAHTAT